MADTITLTGDWAELVRVSNRTAVPQEQGTGVAFQRNFRKIGNKLYTLPEERTEDYALRVFYFRKDEDPTGERDLENGWMAEFPDLVIAEVGLRLAQDLEDTGAIQYFSRMRDEARIAYDKRVAEEEHSTRILTF